MVGGRGRRTRQQISDQGNRGQRSWGQRNWRPGQRGQVMVEFVLVMPLLFLVVGGIIQFVLALNYWLDMQRIANQGARWAVVARYPLPDGTMCSASNPCATSPDEPNSLQVILREDAQSEGLSPNVSICFPAGSGAIGNPVRVRLASQFNLIPILRIRPLQLSADAEMRIEQSPSNVYQATPCETAPPASPPPSPPASPPPSPSPPPPSPPPPPPSPPPPSPPPPLGG